MGRRHVVAGLAAAGVLALVLVGTLENGSTRPVTSLDRTAPRAAGSPLEDLLALVRERDHVGRSVVGDAEIRALLPDEPEAARTLALRAFERLHVREDLTQDSWSTAAPDQDQALYPLAWFLQRYRSRDVTEALLGIVRDPRAKTDARQAAIVGLCRPDGDDHAAVLVGLAVDPDLLPALREYLVHRIHRVEAPLSPRLRELVGVPWPEIARSAAVHLAREGDFTAGSLVRAAVIQPEPRVPLGVRLEALERMVRAAPEALGEVGAAVRDVRELMVSDIGMRDDGWARVSRLRDVVEQTPVDAFVLQDSPFERRARAYRNGEWRQREVRSSDPAVLADLDPAEIDVAAGSLAIEGEWKNPRKRLEQLHTLAEWLRPHLAEVDDPRAKMRRLHDLLRPGAGARRASWRTSSIVQALEKRAGNCMANTLLVQSLGDRLDLPLHPVIVPEHILLQWDDGSTRFFYDPVGDGVDDDPDDHFGSAPPSERRPRRLDRRELLYFAMVNFALEKRTFAIDVEARLRRLRAAIEFAPHEPDAWAKLLDAFMEFGAPSRDDVSTAVRVILDAAATRPAYRLTAAQALLFDGQPQAALDALRAGDAAVDGAVFREPLLERRAVWMRARSLAVLGRVDEAAALLPPFDETLRREPDAQALRIYIALRRDPTAARRELATCYSEGLDPFELHVALARLCVATPEGGEPGAGLALELLAPFSSLSLREELDAARVGRPLRTWKPDDGPLLGRTNVIEVGERAGVHLVRLRARAEARLAAGEEPKRRDVR